MNKKKKENANNVGCVWVSTAAYVVVVICLTSFLAYQISECIIKFIKEPTYYQTNIKQQKDTIFPELTICPYTEACWDGPKDENRVKMLKKSTGWKYLMCGLNGNLTGEWHKQFPCSFLDDDLNEINCQACLETLYPLDWKTNYPEEWLNKGQLPPCIADSEDGYSSLANDHNFSKCSEDDINFGDLHSNFIVSNYTLADFVSIIDITTRQDNNVTVVFNGSLIVDKYVSIRARWTPENGICYTMTLKEPLRQKGISSIEIHKL